jgi:hypothetical protein
MFQKKNKIQKNLSIRARPHGSEFVREDPMCLCGQSHASAWIGSFAWTGFYHVRIVSYLKGNVDGDGRLDARLKRPDGNFYN